MLFVIICLFYYLIIYLHSIIEVHDPVNFVSSDNPYTIEHNSLSLVIKHDLAWLSYIVLPFLVFLKVLLPALCVYIYAEFKKLAMTWRSCLKLSLEAATIFLIPLLLNMIGLTYTLSVNTDPEPYITPFSLSVLSKDTTPMYLRHLFSLINVFEMIYILSIAIGIKTRLETTLLKSIGIVIKSYGIGLIIWTTIAILISVL